MNLSKKILQLRLDKGLSQSELASRINKSRQYIVNIEAGKTSPTILNLIDISTALGIKLTDIMAKDEDSKGVNNVELRAENYTDKFGKFKDVLLYILSILGAKSNIGETALYKIMYFIDFHYYKDNSRNITGATYIRNHFGPTPVEFKLVIDEMIKNKQVVKINSKFFQYEQRKYIPLQRPDLSKLNAKEKHHIDSIISYYGDKTANELSKISHEEAPWQKTPQGSLIEYELIVSAD